MVQSEEARDWEQGTYFTALPPHALPRRQRPATRCMKMYQDDWARVKYYTTIPAISPRYGYHDFSLSLVGVARC